MIRYRLTKCFPMLTLLAGCCFIVISGSFAKPITVEQANDTARTYQLREVVVTATRTPLSPMHSPVAVDVISHFQLTTQNGNSLASALNGSTGILVKDYGGLS